MGESARTPGAVAWPEQMITRAEAFGLAAEWPIYGDFAVEVTETTLGLIQGGIVLRCGKCSKSCGQLRRQSTIYNGSLDEMLSMVLRHMVMAHDVSLAGLRKESTDGA